MPTCTEKKTDIRALPGIMCVTKYACDIIQKAYWINEKRLICSVLRKKSYLAIIRSFGSNKRKQERFIATKNSKVTVSVNDTWRDMIWVDNPI